MTDEIINSMTAGIGIGIATVGALVPLVIMKKVIDNGGLTTNVSGKKMNISVPKMNVKLNMPKIAVKKIKIK